MPAVDSRFDAVRAIVRRRRGTQTQAAAALHQLLDLRAKLGDAVQIAPGPGLGTLTLQTRFLPPEVILLTLERLQVVKLFRERTVGSLVVRGHLPGCLSLTEGRSRRAAPVRQRIPDMRAPGPAQGTIADPAPDANVRARMGAPDVKAVVLVALLFLAKRPKNVVGPAGLEPATNGL